MLPGCLLVRPSCTARRAYLLHLPLHLHTCRTQVYHSICTQLYCSITCTQLHDSICARLYCIIIWTQLYCSICTRPHRHSSGCRPQGGWSQAQLCIEDCVGCCSPGAHGTHGCSCTEGLLPWRCRGA